MPELPEVEVLVRHLRPLLKDKTIDAVEINRRRVLGTTSERSLRRELRGATFHDVSRRGKYLLFELSRPKDTNRHRKGEFGKGIKRESRKAPNGQKSPLLLLGHLGMTGRMYLLPANSALPKHAAVVLNLGEEKFVFEDTRYFGKLTLDLTALGKLGPEPLGEEFDPDYFSEALKRSGQRIKIKLLDQALVCGIGNIYASEALFEAGISPLATARRLTRSQAHRLWEAIRSVLTRAISGGSTVPLNYSGQGLRDGLFYFGSAGEKASSYEERLLVYDRAAAPCPKCKQPLKRIIQAARSTFYCPRCQKL